MDMGKNLFPTVTLPQKKYDELIGLKARVDAVIDLLSTDEFVSNAVILRILGTEAAIRKADEIVAADRAEQERFRAEAFKKVKGTEAVKDADL